MTTEHCPICEEHVPFGDTVHLLIHTKSEEGVVDYYICKACYRDDIEPLLR